MTLATNLVSYWKLDGNSNDAVGSNNGTDTAISYSAGNGIIVQGAGMNGTSSKVALAAAGSLQLTASVSVQAWVNFIDFTAGCEFFNQQYTTTNSSPFQGYRFWNDGNNTHLLWDTNNSGAFARTTITVSAISTGVWHHFVATADAAGGALTFYIDGSVVGSGTAAGNISYSGGVASFGGGNFSGNFLHGAIDEVAVWSRALTSGEVTALYNGGTGFQYPFVSSTGLNRTLMGVGQ